MISYSGFHQRCRCLRAAFGAVVFATLATVCQGQEPTSSPAQTGSPIQVRAGMLIIDLDEINSAEQTFTASVYIEARWHDPALVHGGKPIQRPLAEVWNPRLQIVNQQRAWPTFPETVEIHGDGEVVYRQRIWGSFSQRLNLRRFPFDHQELIIPIVAVGYTASEVEIVDLEEQRSGISGIVKDLSIPDWDVVNWELRRGIVNVIPGRAGIPGMTFHMEVARHHGYYLLKVILPLCLIVAMSWVAFSIDPEEISTNISVAITAVLTIVAYRFAISESLPKVSYMTRMDAFILGSMIMVFMTVGQIVINASLVKRGLQHRARKLDIMARIIYPVTFAILTLWTLGWLYA